MKILCLVSFLVCAYAQSADTYNDALPAVDYVQSRLEDTHLELNFVSENNAVSEDDQLLMSKIESLQRQNRNAIADAIANAIEGFRDVVNNGNDNIPPLDPLVISTLGPYEFSMPGAVAQATIRNLRVEGLGWYILDDVTFNPIRLTLGAHLTVPWITANGNYELRARIAFLNHNAGGYFRVFVNRIEVGVDLRLGTNLLAGHLILRELNVKIDIHDTHIEIKGMYGSSILNTFINSLVQSATQEVVQNEMENISKMISEALFDVINDLLKDYTINDILG